MRALAVTTAKRSPLTPETPTMGEAGVKDFVMVSWQALVAPKGTPKPVIDRLYREMHAVLQMPETRERLATRGSDVVGSTPEQFSALLKEDRARWAKVIKTANIKLD